MLTRTGRRFDFDNLTPGSVAIEDIAHALAHLNRFTGHAEFGYSVGQHSLAVAKYLRRSKEPAEIVLAGLMHDCHEAYFGDVATPLKKFLDISGPEKRIQAFVASELGLDEEALASRAVKLADITSLVMERNVLLPLDGDDEGWQRYQALVTDDMLAKMDRPRPQRASTVSKDFLEMYRKLKAEISRKAAKPAANRLKPIPNALAVVPLIQTYRPVKATFSEAVPA